MGTLFHRAADWAGYPLEVFREWRARYTWLRPSEQQTVNTGISVAGVAGIAATECLRRRNLIGAAAFGVIALFSAGHAARTVSTSRVDITLKAG